MYGYSNAATWAASAELANNSETVYLAARRAANAPGATAESLKSAVGWAVKSPDRVRWSEILDTFRDD